MSKQKVFESYTLGARGVSVVRENEGFVGGVKHFLVIRGLYADNTGCGAERADMTFPDQRISISEAQYKLYEELLQSGSPDFRPHVVGKLEVVSGSD